MDNFKTPGSLPTPVFFETQGQLSTKKARQGVKRVRAPKAPQKSTTKPTFSSKKAAAISFRSQGDSVLASPFYDEYTNDNYLNQCFKIESKIGSGDFGDVYKVVNKEDGKLYAIKRTNTRFRGRVDRDRKLEEVRKNEMIEPHPNLVRFYRAWEENDHLYMQLEYCKMNLEDYAYKHSDIPERTIWYFIVDLLQAVKHMHDHDFVHLDIKPENIFLGTDGRCKLGDFGIAFDLKTQDPGTAGEGDGRYIAPEILSWRYSRPGESFTKAADIFSLGMTLLELACDLDLRNVNMEETIEQIRKGRIPKTCRRSMSARLFNILSWMLNPDPTQRPSAQELLEHPYVQYITFERSANLVYTRVVDVISNLARKVETPRANVVHTPDRFLAQPLNFQLEDTYSDDEFQSFAQGKDTSLSNGSSDKPPSPQRSRPPSPTCELVMHRPRNGSIRGSPDIRPFETSGRTSLSGVEASPKRHICSTPIKLRTPVRTPLRTRSSNPPTPVMESRPSVRRPPSFILDEEVSNNSSTVMPHNSSALSNASTIEPRNLLMSFDAFSDSE